MLLSIALTAATVCTARVCTKYLDKTQHLARDLRRDLLGRDQDILLRDRDETLVCLEIVLRPRHLDRDHIPALKTP